MGGEGAGWLSIKDVDCFINRDGRQKKRKTRTQIAALLSCGHYYITSVCTSSFHLHGNECWTFLHFGSEESSVLMRRGPCGLG